MESGTLFTEALLRNERRDRVTVDELAVQDRQRVVERGRWLADASAARPA
jgi:hypothetical protein